MEVLLRYFDGCPSWRTARDRIEAVLAELGRSDAEISLERVESPEDAGRLGFVGSPTIIIDGRDAFPSPAGTVGLACRVYETPDGLAGCPTIDQLRRVLARG
ncbi:MAG TPA: hypothetical protein VFV62_01560 [Gaiellaceae bacterium]|nr:hypothetical protein [Gaiellaceae bacterium]